MFDDQASPNPYYANFPAIPFGWLYIVVDVRDMSMSKIGLTTNQNPISRILQGITYNPFLMPFTTYELSKCTYGVSRQELRDIESYLHSRATFGGALKHLQSGRDSEWFYTDPDLAENQVDMLIAKRGFSVGGQTLYTCYTGYEAYGDIVPSRMRQIKTIYRPDPEEFYWLATQRGMRYDQFQQYYEYLEDFHSSDEIRKVYL